MARSAAQPMWIRLRTAVDRRSPRKIRRVVPTQRTSGHPTVNKRGSFWLMGEAGKVVEGERLGEGRRPSPKPHPSPKNQHEPKRLELRAENRDCGSRFLVLGSTAPIQ